MIKLGLIGKNIQSSQAPDIHQRLGKLFNISLSYKIYDLNENYKINLSYQVSVLKKWIFQEYILLFYLKKKL